MTGKRHNWGKPSPHHGQSSAVCRNCGIVKVMKSGNGFEWQEYFGADGQRIQLETYARVPGCVEQ